ncbi:MAG: DUF1156 domain-containing protein, partial [Halanaerobiales bacterium]
MKRKFIEYDLPLEEISKESAHEKHVHIGLPPQFHIWWARRPLSSSRATILAALLDDPGKENPERRKKYTNLIQKVSDWEISRNNNLGLIKKIRKTINEQYEGESPKILDPFSGGGSIPLESLRLGAKTYASDYNPVAVLVEKATLEWPQKFGIEIE